MAGETSAPEIGGPGRVGENPGVKVDVERGAWMCSCVATLPQVGAATVAARARVAPGQRSTERRALRLLGAAFCAFFPDFLVAVLFAAAFFATAVCAF